MVNGFDAIQALVVNKKPIRVGHREVSVWADAFSDWVNQGYPTEEVIMPDGSLQRRPVDWITHLGVDMTWAGRDKRFDFSPLAGYKKILEESKEWVVYKNGSGAVLKEWKTTTGVHEHISFSVTSREIWEREFRPYIVNFDPARIDTVGIQADLVRRRSQGIWAFYQLGLLWQTAAAMLGDVGLMEALYDNPEWIHDINRVYTDARKQALKLLFDQAGIPDGVRFTEDLAYKNGLFCSPKMLRQFYLPYFKEIVDFIHSFNIPVNIHTCGNVTQAIPIYIEAGFDILDPLEVKAGCDPFLFAEKYSDHLAFVGGFDVRILETGDRELIRKKVIDLVEGMKARGARYIFSTDHSISSLVKYPDYLYARDIYREHSLYL